MVGTVDSKTTRVGTGRGFGDLRTGREDCSKECCFVKGESTSSLNCLQGRGEVREKMQKPGGEDKQDAGQPPSPTEFFCVPLTGLELTL